MAGIRAMHPTKWEAATPFLANIGLVVSTVAVTYWLRTHVENVYTNEYKEREIAAPPSVAHPKELANLVSWAIELGSIFGTAAVTAGSVAGLLQISRDPSLLIYAGMVLTIVGFAACMRWLSPIKYDKKSIFGVSYLIWAAIVVNGALVAYALLHYHG